MPAPPAYTVLFDGSCRFCVASVRRLRRLAAPGSVRFLDFQSPGVLDSFPGVSPEAARAGIQLIASDGRIFSGAHAIALLLATRPLLAPVAGLYFIPGLRRLLNRLYGVVARNRYRIMGRAADDACPSGACPTHGAPVPRQPARVAPPRGAP